LSNFKPKLLILLAIVVLVALALPVFAINYTPGVTVGEYVKYGNFSGIGPGLEAFNNTAYVQQLITDVSGKQVTLLTTGQFKDGTPTAGNGTIAVWNIETGTLNGVPSVQGPIIAANLNQGDAIPPPDTYMVNQTETRTYLGVSRSVNILIATVSTSGYNSALTYIYDKISGILLESSTVTTTQAQPQPVTSTYSYSIIETNIFNSTNPSPSIPEFSTQIMAITIAIIAGTTTSLIILRRKLPCQQNMANIVCI
jgi:hypothetical protein